MYSSLFFLRLAVAAIFMYHAMPKLREPQKMASAMNWTGGQVFGLGIIEFMSSIAIISSIAPKLGSLALMIVMAGAMYHKIKKWNIPFMAHNGTGWEFDFLLFLANLTIYLK